MSASADARALGDAAEVIADQAKALGATWCNSRRIPAATSPHVSNPSMAEVVTDGVAAPNAAPNFGEAHPLWAKLGSVRYREVGADGRLHDWRGQPYRPYMWVAWELAADDAADAYAESVYSYARSLGFK